MGQCRRRREGGEVAYKKEIIKFQNQLEAVASPRQTERYLVGYNSALTVQTSGPQLTANAAMARQEKVTRADPAPDVEVGSDLDRAKCPTKAYTLDYSHTVSLLGPSSVIHPFYQVHFLRSTYKKHIIIHAAPHIRIGRRPNLLTIHRPMIVQNTLTEPRMTCVV